jgi:hypothetical protein
MVTVFLCSSRFTQLLTRMGMLILLISTDVPSHRHSPTLLTFVILGDTAIAGITVVDTVSSMLFLVDRLRE